MNIFIYDIVFMKIAFCHDWIYHIGGAEGVFFDLIKEYDQSNKIAENAKENESIIFTFFSDRKNIYIDNRNYKIVTALPSWLCNIFVYFTSHKIFILSKIFDYRNLMFRFMPMTNLLSKKINKFDPDLVLISNSNAIKNIYIKNNLTHKILYLHSPLMYIRNHYEDNLKKLGFIFKGFYILAAKFLRPWDLQTRHYDEIFANSKYTADLCQNIYNFTNIKIKYPKIHLLDNLANYDNSKTNLPFELKIGEYYIYIGRLVRFSKDLDTIIYMFNRLGYKLLIIGSGPDEEYLRSIANDNIYFGGYIDDANKKIEILINAKGLINLTMESFGIITAEAMCCGLPIFGYNKGGSVELVDEKSGILVNDKSIDNLTSEFEIFDKTEWDNIYISDRAKKIFG